MPQLDRQRDRALSSSRPRFPPGLVTSDQQSPGYAIVEAGTDLDLVRPRLAPDLCAPRLDVIGLLHLVDHWPGCQQLSVIVAAADTRDEAVDASPDVNGIVHGPPEIMTPDRRRSSRVAGEIGR